MLFLCLSKWNLIYPLSNMKQGHWPLSTLFFFSSPFIPPLSSSTSMHSPSLLLTLHGLILPTLRVDTNISTYCRGNWGSESLKDLSPISQFVRGRASVTHKVTRVQSPSCVHQAAGMSYCSLRELRKTGSEKKSHRHVGEGIKYWCLSKLRIVFLPQKGPWSILHSFL